ncbi:paraquat-inducible protein A [Kaarinaea lacus]
MDSNVQSAKRVLPKQDANILLGLLILSTGLLVAGLVLPMTTITRLVMFSNSFSVVSAVLELAEKGQILLFVIVAGFSIVMPVLKILILYKLVLNRENNSRAINKLLHLMHEYGRWAMLDVMVVAILIVAVKLGAVASVEVHSGLFVFGMSVLMTMFITHRVVSLTSDPESEKSTA